MAELARQAEEWQELRRIYPGVPMVLAGDFNQARSGRRWSYGTNAGRAALSEALEAAGLRSLTDGDLVASGKISEPSHVEHICVGSEFEMSGEVLAWDRINANGRQLSDHPTIAADLSIADTAMR